MNEEVITSILSRIGQKKIITTFEEWSWFKFSNLGLVSGMAVMAFYISVVEGSKLKVTKFLGLIPTFL